MAEITLRTTFKLRRGLAARWAEVNPILAEGEPGFEIDTGGLKIGNGIDAYNDLAYIGNQGIELNGDDITIITENNKISIKGFEEADEGAVPQKIGGALSWAKFLSKGDIESLISSSVQKLTSGDEFQINEVGALELKKVPVSKLDDSDPDTNLVINGGNAGA